MTRRGSRGIARLAAEAFTIFAGVAVALAADDWRETRGERIEVARSLSVIAADLQRDSIQISLAGEGARGQVESARWLVNHWKAKSVSLDSVQAALRVFDDAPRPAFSRAGYEGLSSANRLGLLDSEDLRNALFDYYQVDEPSIASYWEVVWQRRERLRIDLAPHVEHVDPFGPDHHDVLRGTWNSVTADPVLQTDLVHYGGAIQYAGELLGDLQRDVDALLAQLRREVGGGR